MMQTILAIDIGGAEMIPNWVGLPLKETIAKRLGLPTAVLNDGHAAALSGENDEKNITSQLP